MRVGVRWASGKIGDAHVETIEPQFAGQVRQIRRGARGVERGIDRAFELLRRGRIDERRENRRRQVGRPRVDHGIARRARPRTESPTTAERGRSP